MSGPLPSLCSSWLHPPPSSTSLYHSLMTWSLFRSTQCQNNVSTQAVEVRVTMMRNTAMIIISSHFVGFYFVLFCFQFKLLLLRNYFLKLKFPASHSLHTLTHLFFLFPQRPFDTLKSVSLRYNPALLPSVSPIFPFSLFINKS